MTVNSVAAAWFLSWFRCGPWYHCGCTDQSEQRAKTAHFSSLPRAHQTGVTTDIPGAVDRVGTPLEIQPQPAPPSWLIRDLVAKPGMKKNQAKLPSHDSGAFLDLYLCLSGVRLCRIY